MHRIKSAITVIYRASFSLLVVSAAIAQESRVLMDDSKVRVTVIELSRSATYTVHAATSLGSIWIALDDNASVSRTNTRVDTEKVQAGAATALAGGADVQLLNESQSTARLIVIDVKTASQPLTIHSHSVTGSLEDASDRNETLFVAVSPLQISDTRNLGDESRWVPNKPDILRMSQGEIRWIRPGIHHFKNLLRNPANFVLLEW